MTDTPGTLEELEMDLHLARQGDYPGVKGVKRMADEIARLYSLARANNDLARRYADEIASLRARVEVMREALEFIADSGKNGENPYQAARQALKDTP